MSRYRRIYVPGGTYFFTVVTYRRRPLFVDEDARRILRRAIETIRARYPFEMVATVLLPDHLHAIWSLPAGDANYSTRWRRIKEEFTDEFLACGGKEIPQSPSRKRHGMRGVWHGRFWEHTVRDEVDLKRCVHYIHWNPKKHRLVTRIADWKWSTFHRFVSLGEYDENWGGEDPTPDYDTPEWYQEIAAEPNT